MVTIFLFHNDSLVFYYNVCMYISFVVTFYVNDLISVYKLKNAFKLRSSIAFTFNTTPHVHCVLSVLYLRYSLQPLYKPIIYYYKSYILLVSRHSFAYLYLLFTSIFQRNPCPQYWGQHILSSLQNYCPT